MPAAIFSDTQVLAMERALSWAWPATETADVSGWTFRASGGGSRRANSVLSVGFRGGDVDAALEAVEARYLQRGIKSYFHVSSIATPADLDERLAARGYTYEEPCRLMAKALAPMSMPANVDVLEAPSADWLAVYTEPLDAARKASAPNILARVPGPRAFLLARRDGMALASALGVVSADGVALVECVATRSDLRRTGGARVVMDALESWAVSRGAHTAALQVTDGNAGARTLYARRGYAEAARYHYRWKSV